MLRFLKKMRDDRRARRLAAESPQETFARYYKDNTWGDKESASGKGSNMEQTATIRAELPPLLRDLGITSMLDIPCGDFHWMSTLDLSGIAYTGADIVPDLIHSNSARHGAPGRDFRVINMITDAIPDVDLIFTRDCLVHLSFADATAAIANIRRSGATWLMATTFPQVPVNEDILTGQWRRLDMTKPPFNFPAPDRVIDERLTAEGGRNADKSMGLWRIVDLPEPDAA